MEFFERTKWDRSVLAFVTLIGGIVLLLFPEKSLNIATKIIAFALMVCSIIEIIQFILKKDERFSTDYFYFILSIVAIGISISILANPTWIIAVINIAVGIILVVNGIGNFSSTVKIKNVDDIWWAFSITPIVTFILGFIIMANPIGVAKIITRLEGISLIADSISTWLIVYRLNRFLE